ncbi:MAG: replication-associated recombination protein A, partial [Dehalococcoidales bacterium]
ENPSFEVNAPQLSRARVFTLNPLTQDELKTIIRRAMQDKDKGIGNIKAEIEEDALKQLITVSNSDARTALNALELAAWTTLPDEQGMRHITLPVIEDALQQRALLYDRAGEQHYDLISALHKSLRDSDPDASLYWLARMLEAGEDPLFIARRLVRAASEDIGMADPQALVVAMAAQQAVHFIGIPEGNLALAEATAYLATAPKSNSLYTAYSNIQKEVKNGKNDPVPLHLRNAVTKLMKESGYGQGYKYAHNFPGHVVDQQHLPDSLKDKKFYFPGELGYEKQVKDRLKAWESIKKNSNSKTPGEKRD